MIWRFGDLFIAEVDKLDVEVRGPSSVQGKPVNLWLPYVKTGANVGKSLGSVGTSVAGQVTGQGVGLLVAGGALSATGVGLVVVGGVATVGTTVLSLRSAYKTHGHWVGLKRIQNYYENDYMQARDCAPLHVSATTGFWHDEIVNTILPYIIKQKNKKLGRKIIGGIPVVGLLEAVRAVGNKAYKVASCTLGARREDYAHVLAEHLITHNCAITQSIVAELYGPEEMEWIKLQDFDVVQSLIYQKMKST